MSVDDIFADALANRYQIVYIDYLQLLRPGNPREINRVNIVTDISLRLHQCAQQTGILTVALSQLSRAPASDGRNRRPQLTDLRESGQMMDGAHQQFYDAPPQMPAQHKPPRKTPVLAQGQDFQEVREADEKLPF